MAFPPTPQGEQPVNFARGVPPLESIPTAALAAQTRAVLDESDALFQYAPVGRFRGDAALRRELARLHGADPEGIFVGNGSLQVLDLLAAWLLRDGGATVLVEAPTYDRALSVFARHGARVVGLPVGPDGIDPDAVRAQLRSAVPTFLYLIPDFQNPSGVTLSAEKRRALVELAHRHGFLIVEDTPYRELRYAGEAPPGLADIAAPGQVVTLGSLSKVLSPGLRIGYAIGTPELAIALANAAEGVYLSPSPLCQAVAARALSVGLVGENISRLRALFGPRHDAAVATTRALLGDVLPCVPHGGYFFGLHLPTDADEETLLATARAAGLVMTRGSGFYPAGTAPARGEMFVRLPFHALEPEAFRAGMERLAGVLQRCRVTTPA